MSLSNGAYNALVCSQKLLRLDRLAGSRPVSRFVPARECTMAPKHGCEVVPGHISQMSGYCYIQPNMT